MKRAVEAVAGEFWALAPYKLTQIRELIDAKLRGESIDLSAYSGSPDTSMEDSLPYRIENGCAIVSVIGTLARRMNLLQSFSGGMSTQILERNIRHAAANPAVQSILLDVDSPGGAVHGTQEVVMAVRDARVDKRVIAYTGGEMCSAAYWIASAADEIVATETSTVGSIGVAGMHIDRSKADEQEGVKRTWITAGRYKRISNDSEPLSEEGLEYLQAHINDIYASFVDDVAANRGCSVEDVLKNMADGKSFTGKQAHGAGLVDRLGNFHEALSLALSNNSQHEGGPMSGTNQGGVPAQSDQAPQAPQKIESTDALSAAYPDLVRQIAASASEQAVSAERDRVLEILDARGPVDVTRAAVKDGTPSAGVYKLVLQAEREGRTNALDSLEKDLNQDNAGAAAKSKTQDGPGFMALVDAHQKETSCSRSDALRAMARQHPDAHRDYVARINGQEV